MNIFSKIKFKLFSFLEYRLLPGFVRRKMFFSVYRSIVKLIIDHFDGFLGQNIDYENGDLGLGHIHYSLIINSKPKKILCIGSQKGFIPAICALACKHNRKGSVDFVDAGYDQDAPQSWSGIGFWKKVDLNEHFSFIGVKKYINCFIMTNEKFADKFPQKKYDYVYIDGDHSYQGVKLDYELFWSRLRSGGMMFFHDIKPGAEWKGREFGVNKFWQEVSQKLDSFEFMFDSGLGVIKKN